jgi:formamidopyrimidine-DNA glycosylase
MTGSIQHFTHDEKDAPHDRVRFDFGDGHHLAYFNMRLLRRVGPSPDARRVYYGRKARLGRS